MCRFAEGPAKFDYLEKALQTYGKFSGFGKRKRSRGHQPIKEKTKARYAYVAAIYYVENKEERTECHKKYVTRLGQKTYAPKGRRRRRTMIEVV